MIHFYVTNRSKEWKHISLLSISMTLNNSSLSYFGRRELRFRNRFLRDKAFFMDGTAQQLIGTRLGSAILKQIVGSGGMGMVYLAHQEHLDRDVAVKVLRSGIDVSSD